MRTMLKLALVLFVAMTASTMAIANNDPPPVPEGGIWWHSTYECTDQETGQQGTCYQGEDVGGITYETFHQNGEMKYIRRVLPEGGYETLWKATMYDSI